MAEAMEEEGEGPCPPELTGAGGQAKEGGPSIPYAFPPPCVWVSSSGSGHPAPAGPAGLVTEQCFPGPWPAHERRVKPASCPGWSWMAPPAQGCSEGSKPAAGANAPFSRGVLFSEENMRTRQQPSTPP